MVNKSASHKSISQVFQLSANYRLTGHIIAITGILVAIFGKLATNNLLFTSKTIVFANTDQLASIISIVIIAGLVCITFSKEKTEDEFILFMKLKSVKTAFLSGILFAIVMPIIRLFSNNSIREFKATEIIIGMLLVSHFSFHLQKKQSLL